MKKAFTLIELLVYMAIMGFIILVAGRVFSDSASMRVRTQNMTKVTEEINKVAELIKEDLSQMGAKVWKDKSTDSGDIFLASASVYMRAADSSSFDLKHSESPGQRSDSIVFKKIAFNDSGDYVGVRLISWALDSADNVLRRRCVTLLSPTGTVNDPELSLCPKTDLNEADAIIMAKDVQAFHLLPSIPGTQSQAEQEKSGLPFGGYTSTGSATFGFLDRGSGSCNDYVCTIGNILQPGDAGTSLRTAVISGFKYNEKEEEKKQRNELYVSGPYPSYGENYSNCKKFAFKKGETYYVQFETPIEDTIQDTTMSLFQPGVDHAAIGFRASDGKTIERDFLFYAPQLTESSKDKNKKHHFDFSVSADVEEVCAVFTFAFYSPRASTGILRIRDFEIGQKNDAYRFVRENSEDEPDYSPDYASIDDDSKNLQDKKNVKAFELTLEINKGGEIVSTRHYVIPTPNNGISAVSSANYESGLQQSEDEL